MIPTVFSKTPTVFSLAPEKSGINGLFTYFCHYKKLETMNQNNTTGERFIFKLLARYNQLEEQNQLFTFDPYAFLEIADYHLNNQNESKALEVIENAIHNHDDIPDLYIKKASILKDCHRETAALQALKKAESISPENPHIYLVKSEIFVSLHLHEEALSVLRTIDTQTDNYITSEVLTTKAKVYYSLKQYDDMFENLKEALAFNPGNDDALARIWIAAGVTRKYEESKEIHQQILDYNPHSHWAWFNLGQAYNYLSEYVNAIDAYEYAFLLNEDFEAAYTEAAEVCLIVNNYEKALNILLEMEERFEERQENYLQIGQCYQHLGNLKLAKNYYRKATKIDEFDADSYFHLGECYLEEEKPKKAIHFFKKAIQIDDSKEEYTARLAEAYLKIQDLRKAEYCLIKAAEIAAESSTHWIKLIQFYINVQNIEKAYETLEEANNYASPVELQVAEVAIMYAENKKSESLKLLASILEESFDLYKSLYAIIPNAKSDTKIKALISALRPI